MTDGYAAGRGYTVDAYFRLVDDGVLRPEDRVELLDGVIVAEPPMDPPHATGVHLVGKALTRAVGDLALVRVQSPLVADPLSAPEPDVAVVAGRAADYLARHPSTALLVVEVAASSLPQDRLSKSRIYAGAGVAEYWIVNLRDDCVEVFRTPDRERRVYGERALAHRGDQLRLLALPEVGVAVDDLLPSA
jgi:Uma2 family endonuclease